MCYDIQIDFNTFFNVLKTCTCLDAPNKIMLVLKYFHSTNEFFEYFKTERVGKRYTASGYPNLKKSYRQKFLIDISFLVYP